MGFYNALSKLDQTDSCFIANSTDTVPHCGTSELKEGTRQRILIVMFGGAMIVVAVSSALVADAEPGTTKVGAGVLAVFAFILAVLGFLPISDAGNELVGVVRRALRAISRTVASTFLVSLLCIVTAFLAWRWGPSSIVSEPVVCAGSSQIHYVDWRLRSHDPTCKDLVQVTVTSWQPKGRKQLTLRCIDAKGESRLPTDMGAGNGFRCPTLLKPPLRVLKPRPPPTMPPPLWPPKVKQALLDSNGVLDVTFFNPNNAQLPLTRVRGTVLKNLGASPMPYIKPSAKVRLIFKSSKVGSTAEKDLHLYIKPKSLERIRVQLRIRSAARIRFDFFYGNNQRVSVTKTVTF